MKIFLLILFLLLQPSYASIPVKVLKIYDGDTILAQVDCRNKFSIRLMGIDCYETSRIHRAYKQAYINKLDIEEIIKKGIEAKDYLNKIYKNVKEVSFDFKGIDKYGRVLGVVWFDGLNVNQELMDKNLCLPYRFIEE